MLAFGTRVGLEEDPSGVSKPAAVSTSPTVKGMAPVLVSSSITRLAMSLMVGGSFTEFTLTRKTLLLVATPSLTVTVIVAVPNWLVAGLSVTVRLVPLPANWMLALGMRVGLEEAPKMVRLAAGVSTSPTVKLIGPSTTSSRVTWSGIVLMVG